MKTPISYYGGKQNMVRHILPMIPPHLIYCEPFFGGGAVFFAKRPARLSAINDTNDMAINFYRVLKNQFVELNKMVEGTLHSESEHKRARDVLKGDGYSDLERAWAFWVQTNMSFSGKLFAGFAFGNCGILLPKTIKNKRNRFPHYANCLESTEIFNRDALNVISLKDTKETFHYIDPPYVGSDCGHYKGYTQEDFNTLLELLSSIEGKFLLSSYPNEDLLESAERHGWNTLQIEQNLSVDGRRKESRKKSECLTWNYALPTDAQAELF